MSLTLGTASHLSSGMAERITQFYRRAGWMILALLALSLLAIVPSTVAMLMSMRNDVKEWLPAGFQETIDLIWFGDRFGSDEILVVSWPGCTLEDPRLPQLAEKLKAATAGSVASRQSGQADATVGKAGDAPENQPLFKRIFHGSEVAAQLKDVISETQSQMSAAQVAQLNGIIQRRMSGWLLGPDGQTTCAVALVSRTGEEFRHAAVESVYQAAQDLEIPHEELRVGGSTVDSVAIDKASFEGLPPL
jgi:hypothetical protein